MSDPVDHQRERELRRRRENELKDIEVEDTHSERPLEGLSSAGTTWTPDQDESQRSVHESDEAESQARSRAQVPRIPGTPDDG